MRCPKCQYLGFEPSPRCRNCGYDFSLGGQDVSVLTIRAEPGHDGPLADLDLHRFDDPAAGKHESAPSLELHIARTPSAIAVAELPPEEVFREGASAAAMPAARVARTVGAPKPAKPALPAKVARASAPATTELPLFMQVMPESAPESRVGELRAGMPLTIEDATVDAELATSGAEEIDDRPLVTVPAVPRPPLAVRRTTPDPAKLRAKYLRASTKAAEADSDLLRGIDDLGSNLPVSQPHASWRLSAEPTPESLPAGWLQSVGAGKRVAAAAVDILLLGALDAAIVWLTLGVCGLAPVQANILPLVPLLLFFLLVDGGYLVLFTAACGQTIGKMAAGIRVVGTTTGAVINDRVTLGQSVARAIGAIASCLPLGAGFWVSLVGDGRAFHDRIAHTRVVRV